MLVLSFSDIQSHFFKKKVYENTAANESLYSRLHHHAQFDECLKSKFET